MNIQQYLRSYKKASSYKALKRFTIILLISDSVILLVFTRKFSPSAFNPVIVLRQYFHQTTDGDKLEVFFIRFKG
jgi:hypothetical protein